MYRSTIDAEELYDIHISRKDYHGEDIRLISCSTGDDRVDNCFAKKLSKLTHAKVKAPTGIIKVSETGLVRFVGSSKKGDYAIYYDGELIGYE